MNNYEIIGILETIKRAIETNEFWAGSINDEELTEHMCIIDSTYIKNVLYDIAKDYGYIMKK